MTLQAGYFFFPGDYRNQLKAWIKDNCLNVFRFLKYQTAKDRLVEFLSVHLARRKQQGDTLLETIWEIKRCGRHGERQEHAESKDKRYLGYYCNHRKFHLPDAIRYRNGQGVEMKNQYLEIIKANNLWGLYSWTFTLPQEARNWIDHKILCAGEASGTLDVVVKGFLLDCRKAVANTIKETFGLNTKSRNIQPGFQISYHPVSSSDPFRQGSHFHVLTLPLLVNYKTREIVKLQKSIPHKHVKRIYKLHLDRVFRKYGLEHAINPEYTVHLRYIDRKETRRINHIFSYTNRSQVEDVLNTIKLVKDDLSEVICVRYDKIRDLHFPSQKTSEEVLDALEFILNPLIQARMAYGFMRVLDKYADLLGLERDEFEDDKNWKKLYDIDIRRETENVYDLDRHKVITQERVFVRRSDSGESFEQIKPEELRGEQACMQDRKLYKAVRE